MNGLNLHSGGELVTLDQLSAVVTPEATSTHHPLPHIDLVRMAKYALQFFGHEVVEEHHALDRGGSRYFGVLELRSEYGSYRDMVGLRNSSDKSFPIGISFGAKVFVCSNMSFVGQHVIKRKHTQNAKRELPGLLAEIVEPLQLEREKQYLTFEKYKNTDLTPALVDHSIMELYRKDVISVTKIADMMKTWKEPPHQWGGEQSVFKLFNCATWVLSGKVAEDPTLTTRLHSILDDVVEMA